MQQLGCRRPQDHHLTPLDKVLGVVSGLGVGALLLHVMVAILIAACSNEPLTESQQTLATELETVPNGTIVEYTTGELSLIMQGTPGDGLTIVGHDFYGGPLRYPVRVFAKKSIKALHLPTDSQWQQYMLRLLAEGQIPLPPSGG